MKKILIMGMPGAGKGTQAELLKKYKIVHISTGDVIRKSKKKEIVEYREHGYKRGELLSDDLIFEIIKKEISRLPKSVKGYLLDGAVRTLVQAKYVKENDLIDEVIFYKLSKRSAVNRLLSRNEGRSDDNPKAIEHRFIEYNKKTKPVLNYLKKNFKFHTISAEEDINKIHNETLKVLKIK